MFSFQCLWLSCILQLFYLSALSVTLDIPLPQKWAGWQTHSPQRIFFLLWLTWNHRHWSFTYACTHIQKTHPLWSTCFTGYKQIHSRSHMCTCSHTGCFCLFIVESTGNRKNPFVRTLHVLQLIYKGSKLSWPWMLHTHMHSHAHTLLFPHDTMCYDWQIDWPTDCGCGAPWQVEIGKWEAHFSLPSAEQKIKAFSSTEAIERGWAQGVQVVE